MKYLALSFTIFFFISCGNISTNTTGSTIEKEPAWSKDKDSTEDRTQPEDAGEDPDYSGEDSYEDSGNTGEDTEEEETEEEEIDYSAHYISEEECNGLYLELDENGDCLYNCPENSVPDHDNHICICAKNACKVGLDNDFRIICDYPSDEGSEPYFVDGVWSCSSGTAPSNCLLQCVCKDNYVVAGEDSFGRRVCEPPSSPDCPLPYKTVDSQTGECVWNCAKGTEPEESTGTCVCKEGYEPAQNSAWLDDLGRLICFKESENDCNCPSGNECVDGMCLDFLGPGPSYYASTPPLMRGLHNDGGEGERFNMPFDMDINAVKAAVWAEGSGNITMSLYRNNEGEYELLGETELSFSELPFYYGIHSEVRPVFFILEQPVEVFEGDVIDAIFLSSKASGEWQSGYAVSGIYMTDIFNDGEMAFYNGAPGLPGVTGNTDPDWDYLATLIGIIY